MPPNPPRCGDCNQEKTARRYNQLPHGQGIRYITIYLCEQCDLTPEPPVRPYSACA